MCGWSSLRVLEGEGCLSPPEFLRELILLVSQTFLLSKDREVDWIQILHEGRDDYAGRRDRFLRYIKNPEALAELTVDPLADDPNVGSHVPILICLTS